MLIRACTASSRINEGGFVGVHHPQKRDAAGPRAPSPRLPQHLRTDRGYAHTRTRARWHAAAHSPTDAAAAGEAAAAPADTTGFIFSSLSALRRRRRTDSALAASAHAGHQYQQQYQRQYTTLRVAAIEYHSRNRDAARAIRRRTCVVDDDERSRSSRTPAGKWRTERCRYVICIVLIYFRGSYCTAVHTNIVRFP